MALAQAMTDRSGSLRGATAGYCALRAYGFFYWYGFFGPHEGSSRSPAR
jgi:hypothetical protein